MEGLFTLIHFYVFFSHHGCCFQRSKIGCGRFVVHFVSVFVIGAGISSSDLLLVIGHFLHSLRQRRPGVAKHAETIFISGQYSVMLFGCRSCCFGMMRNKKKRWASLALATSVFSFCGWHFFFPEAEDLLAWLTVCRRGWFIIWLETTQNQYSVLGMVTTIIILWLLAILFKFSRVVSTKFSGLREIYPRRNRRNAAYGMGDCMGGFLERPILGWGWYNYYTVFDRHYQPNFFRHGWTETWFDHSHNQYFDMLATGGIAGFLSYLSSLLLRSVSSSACSAVPRSIVTCRSLRLELPDSSRMA